MTLIEVESLAGLALGTAGLVWSGHLIWKARRAKGWSRAEGRIVDYKLDRHASSGGTRYAAEPVYTYEVSGSSYTGSTGDIYDAKLAMTEEAALGEIRARFPVGSQVTVYYHPQRPWKSILSRRISLLLLLVIAASLLFILASLRPVELP